MVLRSTIMNSGLGQQWSQFWMYLPDYYERFAAESARVIAAKGSAATAEDFHHIDLIHVGKFEGIDQFLSAHNIAPGQKLLEIGSGLGGTTRYLAQNGYHVDGVEFLQKSVDASAQITTFLALDDKISIKQGDICTVELPAGSYDGAFAICCYMHVESEQGILNAAQSLKSGGFLYIEDYYFTKDSSEWDERDRRVVEMRGMCGVRTKEEYRRIFEQGGLEVVDEIEYSQFWAETAWKRANELLENGIQRDTLQFDQYVNISPYVSCDLKHLTMEEINQRYPLLVKEFDAEELVFKRPSLSGNWILIGRKKNN